MDVAQPQQKKTVFFLRSLSVKISFFVTALMLVVLGVFSGVFIASERHETLSSITKNGLTFANFSALSIYEDYGAFYTHPEASDFANFKRLVQDILSQNTDITHITMASLSGRIMFDSDEFMQGKYSGTTYRTVTDQTTLNALRSDKTTSRDIKINGKNFTEIVVPVQEGGGGHIVSIRYLLSYNSLTQKMRGVYARIVTVVLLMTIFTISTALLLSLSLVRPILKLTKVAERLRSGDLNAQADTKSKDEIGRLALTFNDMTRRLKAYYEQILAQNEALRHEQIRLKASIESLNVGFVMTDINNQVIMLNRRAREILSYTVTLEGVSKIDTTEHRWDTNVIDQKLGANFLFHDNIAKALGSCQPVEQKEVSYNGRILHIFLAPILDMGKAHEVEKLGTVTLIDDITEAKIIERSKDEFFSIASHELRTPLTAIRGNTSLIQTYYGEQLKDPDLKGMIGDIYESSIRLIGIVNDFLDVSSLEQGKVNLKPESFAIDKVIESVVYEMAASSRQKGIEIKFAHNTLETLPNVYADKNRIKQVVYNLVGNSLKFTEKGGITVDAKVAGSVLKVTVADTGRGIAEDQQKLLFHKFTQASSSLFTRDTTRGTGLGLYICKLLLGKMGGSIDIERSVPGQGTTFFFTIPLAPNDNHQAPVDPAK